MKRMVLSLADGFSQTFIESDRWVLFAKGFGVTIRVAVLALLMGIAIGILVAIVRTKHDTREEKCTWLRQCDLKYFKCNLSGLSDCDPWNPNDGSVDDHVFCYLCIQPSFCCSSNSGFWYQLRSLM